MTPLADATTKGYGGQLSTNSTNGQTVVQQLQRQLAEMRMRKQQGLQPETRFQTPTVKMLLGPSNVPPFQF